MRHLPYVMIFLLILCFFSVLPAQPPSGTLQGKVVNFNTGEAVSGVLVRIEGTKLSARTDEQGSFHVPGVPVGKYNIMCLKAKNYCTMSEPVEILAGKISEVQLKMLPGDPDKLLYFSIGGITVTAERDLIPESHETVHKISSGEIEHMQATNLGDVLDLIPGVERKNRPGLAKQSFVGLRGIETNSSYDTPDIFGTKVIVDGIPLSNNTNLNSGTGVGYGSNVTNNVGHGVDVRALVADNIQEVEVVTGVPSVEYGDLTTGIVKVKTQSGAKPLRLKIKTNPDTREFNMNGGNRLKSQWAINYNTNYAYSLRDLRQDGDEVSRVSGQLNLDYQPDDRGFSWQNRLFYTQLFEDYYLPDDPRATRAWGKDYSLNFGTVLDKKLGKISRVNLTSFINYTRRKNYTRKIQVVDPTYLSNLMESGTVEGILITEPYFWEVNTLGEEFGLGAKLKMDYRIFIRKILHHIMYGMEYLYEDNRGPGKQFDMLRPPNGSTGLRPRTFSEVPGFTQLSVFLEDRITGKINFPYTISLGIRGEMYNPQKLGGKDIIQSRNGTFWNPRFGLQLKPVKGLQVRGSYGITAKAPALDDVYPAPVYHDVLEWGTDPNDPTGQDSIPLVTTHVYRLTNENLQGYTQEKFELGLDYQLKNLGISLTGYHQRTDGTVSTVEMAYADQRYFWPNWPSPQGKILRSERDILLRDFDVRQNLGWNIREGLEISLRTHRIHPLNMIFRMSGSYNFKRHGSDNVMDLDTPRSFTEITVAGDTIAHYGFPMYPPTSGWRRSLFMNYNLDYVNQALGIWVTFTMYHKIFEKKKNTDLASLKNYATGYYENGQFVSLTPQQAEALGLYSTQLQGDIAVYTYPSNFYFNLTVSKHIWEGIEVSLFVNNFLNARGFYTDQYGRDNIANPEIFYGMEFSMILDPFARTVKGWLF